MGCMVVTCKIVCLTFRRIRQMIFVRSLAFANKAVQFRHVLLPLSDNRLAVAETRMGSGVPTLRGDRKNVIYRSLITIK